MIEIDNVYKSFGDLEVIKGVSLTVNKGEVVSIIGGSGSGKSTLLKLLTGLTSPTSGSVSVTKPLHMVFQDPKSSLNPRMPVWKIVAEGGGTREEAERDVTAMHNYGLQATLEAAE